jgi:hypothetical protein
MFRKITWVLDFDHYPEFQKLENKMFWKLHLIPVSGEGRKVPTLLGHFERANINHWTKHLAMG